VDPVVFKVTISSGNFMAFLPNWGLILEPASHTSEALTERYLNGSQRQLIIQTVYILQLDSAVTDSLPRGRVVRPFQPYFPIT
jgi:hypothetical protein